MKLNKTQELILKRLMLTYDSEHFSYLVNHVLAKLEYASSVNLFCFD